MLAARADVQVDRFQLLRRIASGGLSEVLEAHDAQLNRRVALKRERLGVGRARHARCRTLFEAEVTANLEHPGILPVHAAGSWADGRAFFAMRLVRGDNLLRAIQRAHAPERVTTRSAAVRFLVARLADACATLAYAHDRGVVHRDLTPKNIMLGPHGETLIIDWGLAKLLGAPTGEDRAGPAARDDDFVQSTHDLGSTQAGSVLGTPRYMSPEQAAAQLDRQGPATDVYGLGAVLYHVLTGRPPFEGDDKDTVLRHVVHGAFPAPARVFPRVDARLERTCLKAMAHAPDERHASVRALDDDLRAWLGDDRPGRA